MKTVPDHITFVCWKWRPRGYRTTYTAEHVNIWAESIRRNYAAPHRLLCVTDDPTGISIETFPLWDDLGTIKNPNGNHLPSCYRRLKIFDPVTTSEMDVDEGSLVCSLDLDIVVMRDLVPMLSGKDVDFLGWKGPGSHHPVVYNGTFFMFRAGRVPHLYRDFDPRTSPAAAAKAHFFGSDQGWLSFKLNGSAPGLTPRDGLLSYSRDIQSARLKKPPPWARIVSFNGKHKPWDRVAQFESPWIKDYYHA